MEDQKDTNSSSDLFDTLDQDRLTDKVRQFFRTRKDPVVMMSVENLTVILAILCVIFVIVFYLGFVRGQDITKETLKGKLRMLKSKQELVRRSYPTWPSIAPPPAQSAVKSDAEFTTPLIPISYAPPPAVEKTSVKPYTIQVVAYRSNAQAQKEIQKLKIKGYEAKAIVDGSHFVVVVGQYRNGAAAAKDLSELKRDYRDCYLRKFEEA